MTFRSWRRAYDKARKKLAQLSDDDLKRAYGHGILPAVAARVNDETAERNQIMIHCALYSWGQDYRERQRDLH